MVKTKAMTCSAAAAALLVITILPPCVRAECPARLEWERTYDPDGVTNTKVFDTAVCPDGNVVVAGQAGKEAIVRKYSPGGALIWSVNYPAPSTSGSAAYAVAVDASGSIYIGGCEDGGNPKENWNWLVAKFSPGGSLQWARSYNGSASYFDLVWDIAVDAGGNVVAGGTTNYPEYWMVRVWDKDGNVKWTDIYAPAGNSARVTQVAFDAAGNAYAAGFESFAVGSSWRIKSYDSAGAQRWLSTFPDGMAEGIATAPDGNLWAVGSGGVNGLVFRKLSPAGSLLATVDHPSPTSAYNYFGPVTVDALGNLFMYFGGDLFKYDSAGSEVWKARGQNCYFFGPVGVAAAADGSICVGGYSDPASGTAHYWMFLDKYRPAPGDCYDGELESGKAIVYPNPVRGDHVTVAFDIADTADLVEVAICNSAGDVAFSGKWRNVSALDRKVRIDGLGKLHNGVYTVRVKARGKSFSPLVMVVDR